MNRIVEIDYALGVMASAKSRVEYESGEEALAKAARQYPAALIEYFREYPEQEFHIAWSLAHVDTDLTKNFFLELVNSRNHLVRWSAYIRLSHYRSPDMVNVFVKGLKDKSSYVRGEALKAVKGLKDERIADALRHMISLKSIRAHSPGYLEEAEKLLAEYARSTTNCGSDSMKETVQ